MQIKNDLLEKGKASEESYEEAKREFIGVADGI